MPQFTFKVRYKKDTSLLVSVNDFKNRYLYGVELQRYGKEMPDYVYEQSIISAQEKIEEYLQIKLLQQVYTEGKNFYGDDWRQWSYIPTQYPVKCPLGATGFIGTVKQVDYPKEWMSAKRTSDGQYLQRQIHLVPNASSTHNQLVYVGMMPNTGTFNNRVIPNYWQISYVTGWDRDKIPATILSIIGKLAAMDILATASDMLLPYPGVGSTSISLDGLSQTISSFANGTTGVFGARIKQYGDELYGKTGRDGELKRLYDTYGAIIWGVC